MDATGNSSNNDRPWKYLRTCGKGDAYTVSRTTAGERVIKALETRLAKVRSTTAELERVGAFYVRIVDFCIKNPPKDNRHLKALQEQVFLSKQQIKDLSGKVRDLLLEKDAIERVGIHSLKAQLARRERAQQKVRARMEQLLLREQTQKSLKSERKGRHPREGGNINSTSFNARGTGNANQGSSSTPSEGQGWLTTTNSTLREKQRPESRRDTPMQSSTKEGESLEEALEKLAILVGAEDIDDITAKLKTVQEREENLNAQKETAILAAERLHLELEDCQKQLSDLELREGDSASGIVVGGGAADSNAALSTTSNENLHCKQRELDDLVLQSSIRLKQARRKANKAKEVFNDLRVGIIHLARVIDFVVRQDENTGTLIPVRRRVRRTLQANMEQRKLPFTHAAVRTAPAIEGLANYEETVARRVPPPEDVDSQFGSENEAVEQPSGSGLMDTFAIGQEENVCKLLGACEERVRGVMELCGIKADEELGTIATEAMTVYTRTTNEGFWHSGLSANTVPIDRQLITEGPGTPSILDRLLMGRVKGFESDGAGMDIRTLPPKARDDRFERNMAEALRKQNEKLEMQEREVNDLDRKAVASFLEDALSSKSANMHLRRANMLMMGRQGKRAGFGLVMNDVLNNAHIDVLNLATTAKKTSTKDGCFLGRNDLSSTVLERPAIKASAQVLSSRRKQERRKRASWRQTTKQANPA